MFTGLIEDVGTLLSLTQTGNAAKLQVKSNLPASEISLGDSIAVNGACLTVESLSAGTIHFHALQETLRRTNLGLQSPGSALNLERALRLSDRLGGHLVSGHVDAMVPILSIGRAGDDLVVTAGLPSDLRELVIMKGSVALNGVSLTVASLEQDSFTTHIIPHTWTHTNLSRLRTGDQVNLEVDMIGRYVLRRMQVQQEQKTSAVSMETLNEAGFV